MKKILIIILIVLLVALLVFIGLNGLTIGQFQILGVKQIQEKNLELDNKIEESVKLIQTDYKQQETVLNASIKQLEVEKKEYDQLVQLATTENGVLTGVLEEYEYETILIRIGSYSTMEDTIIQWDLVKANSIIEDYYNINFTLTGSYISIIDFLSKIENDDILGFRIENFALTTSASVEGALQATFTCSEIVIKGVSAESSSAVNQDTSETENVEE